MISAYWLFNLLSLRVKVPPRRPFPRFSLPPSHGWLLLFLINSLTYFWKCNLGQRANRGQCGRLPSSPRSSDRLTQSNFLTFLFFSSFSASFPFFPFLSFPFLSHFLSVFFFTLDQSACLTTIGARITFHAESQYLRFLERCRVPFRSPCPSISGQVNYLTRYEGAR